MTECKRCLFDETTPNFSLDADGICNVCRSFEKRVLPVPGEFERVVEKIKTAKNKYDCLIGISGGVDSCYVTYLAWKHGLRPLVVHFDNGWNAETAVKNIKAIISKTGFDYETYVIPWPEFRDLQRAFFKAGVIDIEMLTDHAIMAVMLGLAEKNDIPYVLSGTNVATENGMPKGWNWMKLDLRNIKAIHRRFGERSIKNFPTISLWSALWRLRVKKKPVFLEPLNMINFRKDEAVATLKSEFGWMDYGGKHFESVFTKFYQAYILPKKFNVDKRRMHLSALIRNGELSKQDAHKQLSLPLYNEEVFSIDRDYILKKLGFSREEFDAFMNATPVPHDSYPSDKQRLDKLLKLKVWFGF